MDGLVSIIIPTHESARVLEDCLKSIKEQNYPALEVIVVDGFSKDGTGELASRYGCRVIQASGTQAAARKIGLNNAKGRYILFLDSDQRLGGGVIDECVRTCWEMGAEAVKIPETFMGLDFWGKSSALWKNRMVEAWGPEGGIPRFFRRDILKGSGTFREGMRFWEDIELYEGLKRSGLRETQCRCRIIHLEDHDLRRVTRKYVSYGRSMKAHRGNSKGRYAKTAVLTISTMIRLFRKPGDSLSIFIGCLLIVAIKTLSIFIGIISRAIT